MPEPFTAAQRQQLLVLAEAGATRADRSKPLILLRPGSVNVLGLLARRGLVASKVVRRGRQWTEYWLTADGVAAVRELHDPSPSPKDHPHG